LDNIKKVEKNGNMLKQIDNSLKIKDVQIRTPASNMEIDEGVDNKKRNKIIMKEEFFYRSVVFDINIISNELAGLAICIISRILEESRSRKGFVNSQKTDEEDKILYERLQAFLMDTQKIIRLQENEMLHGLILFEKVYKKHGNGNNFHSSFVDLIFYLVTCIIIAHKFNSDGQLLTKNGLIWQI
jgi:hypothetical protein